MTIEWLSGCGTGALPRPAAQRQCILWVAGRGSGPVPPETRSFARFHKDSRS